MSQPLVSVLFVSYNRPFYLERAVKSVRKYFPGNVEYEIVITDDGSNTETVKRIYALNPDKTILSLSNEGAGANSNKGLRKCQGEYVLYMQDDCVAHAPFTESLTRGLDLLQKTPNIDIFRFLVPFAETMHSFASSRVVETGKEMWEVVELCPPKEEFMYVYSDLPHLRRRSFPDKFGYYPEGLSLVETENYYVCEFIKKRGIASWSSDVDVVKSMSHIGSISTNQKKED